MNQYVPQSARLEPNWIEECQLRISRVPAETHDWLIDQGSLTARIKRFCPGRFRVRVRTQGPGKPMYSEGRVLHMRRGETAVVREVELLCDDVPWVFARTVIPVSSLRGAVKRLTMLGTKPLGEVLFADPKTRRVVMEMARLHARHKMFHSAIASIDKIPKELWGRRTLFRLEGAPLLVNEIFLPAVGKV